MRTDVERSNCCDAGIETQYGEEGTNFYTCSKCVKACDVHMENINFSNPTPTLLEDQGKRIEALIFELPVFKQNTKDYEIALELSKLPYQIRKIFAQELALQQQAHERRVLEEDNLFEQFGIPLVLPQGTIVDGQLVSNWELAVRVMNYEDVDKPYMYYEYRCPTNKSKYVFSSSHTLELIEYLKDFGLLAPTQSEALKDTEQVWITDKGFWGKQLSWFVVATYGFIVGYLTAKGLL